MTKVEYSDLYKFMVSMGLALIVVSVGVPWLFLREPFDLLTSQQAIVELSPSAQSILERRRDWIELIVNWWWVLSLVFLFTGIILVAVGFELWRRNQLFVDRKNRADTLRAEKELQNLSTAEKVDQVRSEVEARTDRAGVTRQSADQLEVEVFQRISVEKRVTDRIVQCFANTHLVLINKRIGPIAYDVVLQPLDMDGDIIVEIKSYSSQPLGGNIASQITQSVLAAQRYAEVTKRTAKPIILCIIGPHFGGLPISIEEYANIESNKMNRPELHAMFVTLDDFLSMSCSDLRKDFLQGGGVSRIW